MPSLHPTQPTPATAAWLPLLVVLLAVLVLSQHACGPSLAQQTPEEDQLQSVVRRNAVRLTGPEEVRIKAGQAVQLEFELRIAPGFYLPSHDEPDTKALATWIELPKRSFARIDKVTYPHGTLVQLPTRVEPLLAYDRVVKIELRLAVHRSVAAIRYLLPFVVHYQLCTVRGCEVPESQTARVAFEVLAADAGGDMKDLAPTQ